jgi:hypothetical protein
MMPLLLAVALLVPTAAPAPAATTTRACRLVHTLERAGFTGRDVRIGWAVVMRESGGQARQVTNGADYGLFQINRPTHPGYSRAQLLDGPTNARIARRIVAREGWRPWGLNRSGTGVDARDYEGIWSQWRIDNWIWTPYAYWRARFPRGC